MIIMRKKIKYRNDYFYVIHPLDDQVEEKCQVEGLGLMALSPTVKYSLISLRLYLIFMVGLVVYRILHEMGIY